MMLNIRAALLTGTLLSTLALFSSPVAAQDTVPAQSTPDPAEEEAAEVVVTGSRIARRDLESAAPVAVVQAEEFKLSGAVNVEQVINTLPQVIPGTTSFSNNPGGGVATLDLRGLGSNENLVLVNGRRWMFFDTAQTVDLNTIPQFLISSVDVVTGGASAVYGSDAVAGVINFRLRTDLNGVEAGGQVSITEKGDGLRRNAYLALGTSLGDGRGHVTVFGEYYKRNPVFQNARRFSNFTFGDVNGALARSGSATVPQGRITAPGSVVIPAGNGQPQVTLQLGSGNFASSLGAFFGQPGISSAYNPATDVYNFAPANYLQVPQERWLAGGYGEYAISDAVKAYIEVTSVNNRVANELAPTPVTGTIAVGLAANRPYLSAADFAALQQIDANETAINAARAARGLTPLYSGAAAAANAPGVVALGVNRRVSETGSRNSLDERNAFRVLGGLRGDITNNVSWDAYYLYARTRNANVQSGNISRSAFNSGVLNGTINVFGPGTLTPTMVDSIAIQAQNGDISELQVAQASVSGSPFNLGLGADDVGFAFGVEYRKLASEFIPDTALSSGDVVGFNAGQATQGSYDVKEAFGELRVPVVAGRPFLHRLELTAAARYSDYSLDAVGGVWTYAGGLEFAPVRDITLRGQYQRAVRAPNVGELYGGQSTAFPAATDPCSSRNVANRTDTIRQLCIATGVPAALVFTSGVQPNDQIQGIFGGNPDLQEETSDSYTIGAVIRPSFIPRLNITIDAYRIKIRDTIGQVGGTLGGILDLCYNKIQNANSLFCSLIDRNPNTGAIEAPFLVTATNANQGKLETQGIDLQVDYSIPLNGGLIGETARLGFFFLGTYTDRFRITPVAELPNENTECSGKFGTQICLEPKPRWKWTTRLSYNDGPLTLSGRWRHISAVRDDNDGTQYVVERLPAYNLFDISLLFDIDKKFTLGLGVNNLLDKEPRIIGSNQSQANTYPGTYDVLGRDYFVSASLRF